VAVNDESKREQHGQDRDQRRNEQRRLIGHGLTTAGDRPGRLPLERVVLHEKGLARPAETDLNVADATLGYLDLSVVAPVAMRAWCGKSHGRLPPDALLSCTKTPG
jgi:hypothetical protein